MSKTLKTELKNRTRGTEECNAGKLFEEITDENFPSERQTFRFKKFSEFQTE